MSGRKTFRRPNASASTVFGTPLGCTKTVPWPASRIRSRRTTVRHQNRINLATSQSTRKTMSGRRLSSTTNVAPGCGDLKWKALVRDGFHCRGCAVVVTSKTSHADHIEPVNRFANLDMANSLDNIQTLCLRCHKLKTARETMSIESSGKPDAWKLARPVWGWGRGEIPRPTPLSSPASCRSETCRNNTHKR